MENIKIKNLKLIKPINILGVVLGALFSAAAIKFFVQPGSLVPSGVAGLTSLVTMEVEKFLNIELSFSLVYLIINFSIISFVFKKLGMKFLSLSLVHVVLTSFFVEVLPAITLTKDIILMAVFGGLANGIGVSLALRANGSAGGTDFIAVYYSMVKNKPMWDKIMFFNISMLLYYGWQYNWSLAFYSIIYQILSTQIIETYHDRYKLSSIRIVTIKPHEVSGNIHDVVRHGITKLNVTGMYNKKEKSMLYMVANDFEIDDIVDVIKETDDDAFIEIASVQRIEGNYRQRPLD